MSQTESSSYMGQIINGYLIVWGYESILLGHAVDPNSTNPWVVMNLSIKQNAKKLSAMEYFADNNCAQVELVHRMFQNWAAAIHSNKPKRG